MDISKLKKVIQEANPSILELQFGCEVAGKDPVPVLKYVGCNNGQHALAFNRDDKDEMLLVDKLNSEILGRPIRLSDVLVAIEKVHAVQSSYQPHIHSVQQLLFPQFDKGRLIHDKYWNLLDDNLDNQSDECKKFLTELLTQGE